MLNKWIKNKSYLLLMGVIYLASACETGIDLDRLPLNDHITEDARTAFFEGDRSGVINDYAQVDTGESTSDGFNISQSTDADIIMNAATSDKGRLFIQLPGTEARRDHILRALAAASIREDLKKGDTWNLIALNTKAIKSEIATYGFEDPVAKQYFLTIARKLNKKLTSRDVLIVNIDDFSYGLTADELFAEFTMPHIVALSSHGIDTVKYFDNKKESSEFLSKGLNPGHTYQLMKLRLQRSKSITETAKREKVALTVAKVITALEPNGNLGSVAKFLTLVEPIIEGETSFSDLHQEIMKALASFFQANYDFLVQLQLESKSLSQIHEDVKQNALAYSEQARKTDKILKDVEILLSAGIGTLGEVMARGFRRARADLDDIRNSALPQVEQNIVEESGRNRDDIIASTKRSVAHAISRLADEEIERHNDTQKAITRKLASKIDDAEQNINEQARLSVTFFDQLQESMRKLAAENARTATHAITQVQQALGDTQKRITAHTAATVAEAQASLTEQAGALHILVSDELSRALRRIIAENKSSVTGLADGINVHTTTTVKRSERILTDALVQAENEIKRRLIDEGQLIREDNKMVVAKDTATAVDQLRKSITDAQKRMISHTSVTISDSHAGLDQRLVEQSQGVKDLMNDLLAAAIKKIAGENRSAITGLNDGINAHTTSVIKKAQQLLTDALVQAEEEIKKRIIDEGLNARNDVTKEIAKRVNVTAAGVIAALRSHVDDARKALNASTRNSIGEAQELLERGQRESAQDVKDAINDGAIKRMLAENKAAITGVSEGINVHTTGTVKRARDVVVDRIAEAEGVINKNVGEEGAATREQVNDRLVKEVAKSNEALIRQAAQDHQTTQQRLMKHSNDVAEANKDALEAEMAKRSQEVIDRIDSRIRDAFDRLFAANQQQTKTMQDNNQAVARKEGGLTREQLVAAEGEIKKIVQEEADRAMDEMKRLPGKNRRHIAELLQRVTRMPAPSIVALHYRVLLEETIKAATGGVTIASAVIKRVNNAVSSVYRGYDRGDPAVTVEQNARTAFNTPPGAGLPLTNAVISITNQVVNMINRARALENVSNAPKPDIALDNVHDAAFNNHNKQNLQPGLNELLDQISESLENGEVEKD